MKVLHHPAREDIQLTAVLCALSDPIRLSLLADVAERGELSCGAFDVPVAKSTLSHHVRTLRESGVVNVRVQGTQHFVTIRRDDLEARFPGLLATILQAARTTVS